MGIVETARCHATLSSSVFSQRGNEASGTRLATGVHRRNGAASYRAYMDVFHAGLALRDCWESWYSVDYDSGPVKTPGGISWGRGGSMDVRTLVDKLFANDLFGPGMAAIFFGVGGGEGGEGRGKRSGIVAGIRWDDSQPARF